MARANGRPVRTIVWRSRELHEQTREAVIGDASLTHRSGPNNARTDAARGW
jgi:hypothetical protein